MITELDLRRELKQAGILLNAPVKTEFATEVYERIAHRYNLEDLKTALTDLLDSEVRLTYPALNKRLREAKSTRMDVSNGKEKQEELRGVLCPEIMNMVNAVISGDKAALEKYGMSAPLIVPNCVVIGKDGRRRHMFIDPKQPGMDAALVRGKDDKGNFQTMIDLKKVEWKEIDDRLEAPPLDSDDFLERPYDPEIDEW